MRYARGRDSSPRTIQAALPALRAIADATQAAEDLGILASGLATVNPAEAENLMRSAQSIIVSAASSRRC